MALPGSGALSIGQIAGEFGGNVAHALNEYYRGGSYVPTHAGTTSIPSSGAIGIGSFYGASKILVVTKNITSQANYNLRNDLINNHSWNEIVPVQVDITIPAGNVIWSTPNGIWAWRIGSALPAGSSVILRNYGYIIGSGGYGVPGRGINTSDGLIDPGYPSSWANATHALYVEWYLTLYNYGYVGGGGGGGGSGYPRYKPYMPSIDPKTPSSQGYRAGAGGGGRGAGYPYQSAAPGGAAQAGAGYTVADGGWGGTNSSYTGGAGGGGGGSPGVVTAGAGGAGGSLGATGATGAVGSGGIAYDGTTGAGPGYAYYRTNSAYLSVPVWGNILGQTY